MSAATSTLISDRHVLQSTSVHVLAEVDSMIANRDGSSGFTLFSPVEKIPHGRL
jgi:hypothetical protein